VTDLRLALATRAETFDRIRDPLADRGVDVDHLPTTGRTRRLDPASAGERFDVGLVFPARVMEGGAVSALSGLPWVNDREVVLRSRNKAETYARCARAGLPVPDTRLVSNPADEDALADAVAGLDWPVVVKPNSTTRGIGVTKCHDLDSFLGVADYLSLIHEFPATGDRSFLVQEFLPEARDYRAMVVDGAYAGAVERRSAGGWKHNVHRGAEAVGVDLPAAARRLAEDAAAALSADWLGVDLLRTGDRWVVNETNARPTVDDEEKYEAGFYDRLAELLRRTS
jgi:ribosomal protein S6--L-glutamate ligase